MWGKTSDRESTSFTAPQTASTPLTQRSPASVPQVAPQATTKPTASIGKTMRLRGDIRSDEELYLDGELEGTIEVRSRLTIGPNGKIKANVKANEVVVRGSIQGNVEAIDRISIMNGASIVGDVKTAGIVIEDGAYFKGGIDILRPESKKPEPASSSSSSALPSVAKAQGAGVKA
jgi:cytoskeletal protein CcmA (bactofilin family)